MSFSLPPADDSPFPRFPFACAGLLFFWVTLALLDGCGEGLPRSLELLLPRELVFVRRTRRGSSSERVLLAGASCFVEFWCALPTVPPPDRTFAGPRLLGAGFFPVATSLRDPPSGLRSEVLSFLLGHLDVVVMVEEGVMESGLVLIGGDVFLGVVVMESGDADAGVG